MGLADEHHFLRDAGQLAVFVIGGAAFGRYSARPISACPRPVAYVKVTATWHIAIPPIVPLYWRAAPAVGRGLLIGRLIHDQHRIPVVKVIDCPCRRDVRNVLFVPGRPRQQVLQPVRPAMPGRLGDRPAVVIFQFHQQPVHHLAAALPGLPPGKAPGHPPQQVRQQRGPGIIRYRGSSDCRILIVSCKPIMIAAAAPLRGPPDLHQQSHGHELLLPYQSTSALPAQCLSSERTPAAMSCTDGTQYCSSRAFCGI